MVSFNAELTSNCYDNHYIFNHYIFNHGSIYRQLSENASSSIEARLCVCVHV